MAPNQYIIKLNTDDLDYRNQSLIEQKIYDVKDKLGNAVTDLRVIKTYKLGKIIFILVECEIDKTIMHATDVPEIAHMEANLIATGADCVTQKAAPWSLSRISKRGISFNFTYDYGREDGNDTYAYVLDTGIYTEHDDFGGRADLGYTYLSDNHRDENGHGTHCTGTIMSGTYGVAKRARAISVKVLGEDNTGWLSDILGGIQWVLDHYNTLRPESKAVVSMSLGTPFSAALNEATSALIDAGLTVVVSAMNDNTDACLRSPASLKDAITVAASNVLDKLADYSNYGDCVDIIAPGSDVLSTYTGSKIATKFLSGTSMAAPHVTGVLMRRLSRVPGRPSPAELKEWLLNSTSNGRIDTKGKNVPNKLLYAPCDVRETSHDSAALLESNIVLVLLCLFLI